MQYTHTDAQAGQEDVERRQDREGDEDNAEAGELSSSRQVGNTLGTQMHGVEPGYPDACC